MNENEIISPVPSGHEILGKIQVIRGKVEDQIRLRESLPKRFANAFTKELPDKIGEAVAKYLGQISLNVTETVWVSPVAIDLSVARSVPTLIGHYAEGGDCVVYLPDSAGAIANIYFDNPTTHAYAMGTYFFKIRAPFSDIYLDNAAQAGATLYLLIAKGNIDIERIAMSGIDLQAQYTTLIDSTVAVLAAAGTYTSPAWVDLAYYGFASALVSANVAGTLYLQWSNDGVNLHYEDVQATAALVLSDGTTVQQAIIRSDKPTRYCRLHYVNAGANQASMSLFAFARVID